MSVKKILTEPNKILRQVSKNVERVGDEERTLMNDMLDTMYDAPELDSLQSRLEFLKEL